MTAAKILTLLLEMPWSSLSERQCDFSAVELIISTSSCVAAVMGHQVCDPYKWNGTDVMAGGNCAD